MSVRVLIALSSSHVNDRPISVHYLVVLAISKMNATRKRVVADIHHQDHQLYINNIILTNSTNTYYFT